jgi:large subunit GTPase 1
MSPRQDGQKSMTRAKRVTSSSYDIKYLTPPHRPQHYRLNHIAKMVLAKSKNAVGLGNSLMNDRFGRGKGSDMRRVAQGIRRTAPDGTTYVTTPQQEAAWVKMRSITEQGDLDEFLTTAELAGTDFTAEKMNNVKIIHKDQKNPYLLSATDERARIRKQDANKKSLTVPRRPKWGPETTAVELDEAERNSLLQWRRGLAEVTESQDLLLTPFERNLEVWRQLWRVIERSDLVVQIVDARNPLMFRCEDLEHYVKEVDSHKNNLLLVNKADLMTLKQREAWAEYFKATGVNFRFFSAELAKEMNEAKDLLDSDAEEDGEEDEDESSEDDEIDSEDIEEEIHIGKENKLAQAAQKLSLQDQQDDSDEWASDEEVDAHPIPNIADAEPTRILTTTDLEELFLAHSPTLKSDTSSTDGTSTTRKIQIGLVGYPNVGKSSTINALLGAKKVSVSATPGKTKHFQTLHLSDRVVLCDCPGLVFPNFATTKAELVCNGVLPIDQLREYTGPATLVAQRIPKPFLEAIYGMKIPIRPLEEGGTGTATGEEVLRAYASARGFQTSGLGQPDESRAARYVLKDYVKGKLLYCHAPPSSSTAEPTTALAEGQAFNRELYDAAHLPQKRRAYYARQEEAEAASSVGGTDDISLIDAPSGRMVQGEKTKGMDNRFFAAGQRGQGKAAQPFHYKYSEQGSAKELSGRKLKTVVALERDVDPADMRMTGKKHFKGAMKKKSKVRGVNELGI